MYSIANRRHGARSVRGIAVWNLHLEFADGDGAFEAVVQAVSSFLA